MEIPIGESADFPNGIIEGVGPSIKLRNRVRNLVKIKYEDWLEWEARSRVFDFADKMNPKQYSDSMKAVALTVGAKTYRWGGDCWGESLSQTPGQVMLALLLAEDADEILEEKQKLTIQKMTRVLKHDKHGPVVGAAVTDIMKTSPDFLEPPIRTGAN